MQGHLARCVEPRFCVRASRRSARHLSDALHPQGVLPPRERKPPGSTGDQECAPRSAGGQQMEPPPSILLPVPAPQPRSAGSRSLRSCPARAFGKPQPLPAHAGHHDYRSRPCRPGEGRCRCQPSSPASITHHIELPRPLVACRRRSHSRPQKHLDCLAIHILFRKAPHARTLERCIHGSPIPRVP